MVARPEDFENVVLKEQPEIRIYDFDIEDSDRVDVTFNGELISDDLLLTNAGTTIQLPPLNTATANADGSFNGNLLEVVAQNIGTSVEEDSNTPGIEFLDAEFQENGQLITRSVLFASDNEQPVEQNLVPDTADNAIGLELGLPIVRIDGSQAPFAADHIIQTLGDPTILTLDRDIKAVRDRRSGANTRAYRRENGPAPRGFDIDEVPPASTLESDRNTNPDVSTRAIPRRDNRSGGGQFQGIINNYGDPGARLPDGTNIDFFATEANYSTGISGFTAQYGTEEGETIRVDRSQNRVVYGLGGNDRLFGRRGGGADVLIGGEGSDEIRGRGGNDILLGGEGEVDRLYGGADDDILIGGAGNDYLEGGSGSDSFYLDEGIGADLIDDFGPNDAIVVPDELLGGIDVRDDGRGIGELLDELASSLNFDFGGFSFAAIAGFSPPLIRAIIPSIGVYSNNELIGVASGLTNTEESVRSQIRGVSEGPVPDFV